VTNEFPGVWGGIQVDSRIANNFIHNHRPFDRRGYCFQFDPPLIVRTKTVLTECLVVVLFIAKFSIVTAEDLIERADSEQWLNTSPKSRKA
jgi:hypothetical protein